MSLNSPTESPTKSPHHHHHPDYKGFFKRHFSLNKKNENSGTDEQQVSSSTREINEDMANLSLKSENTHTIEHSQHNQHPSHSHNHNKEAPLAIQTHSDPTVQHTDHVLTPRTEEVPIVVETDSTKVNNDSNKNDNDTTNNETNPTILSLKQTLLDDKTAEDSIGTPITSAGSGSTRNDVMSDHLNNMNSNVPESQDSTLHDTNVIGSPYGKKESHPYQYEYFPLTSDKNSNSIDEDAGVLQNEDKLINQAIFQNVVKRDMKRKRNDSMSSGNTINRLGMTSVKETKREQQNENDNIIDNEKQKPKVSATAAIMMKLYNNNAQMKNDKSNEIYKRNETLTNNNNNSDVDFKESLRRRQEEDAARRLAEEQANVQNPTINKLQTDSSTLTSDNKKVKMKKTITSESSYSSDTDTDMDDDEDDVEVILKWRDKLPDSANVKIFVISKEIVSTILAIHPHYEMDDSDKKECRLHMIFDDKTQEWFLPGLFLPPGIYRFQFSINGNLTHSNYLPTATNTLGSIVNWFEVLPGYEQIEPYRDYDKINSSSVNLTDDKNAQRTYSTASLTDYAGISRSNSMINKSSGSTLRIANYFNALQPLTPKEPEYSNEIPELFKFDADLTNPAPPPVDLNAPFDMTLSKVVDCNQDELFANMQRVAKMNADEAEKFFLTKFKVAELPVYLNSNYLNKNFNTEANHIIPHVNLNHLLTSSIKDEIICVGCTTRYAGKFITQVIYAPCSSSAPKK
ncbi:hypothetical protein C6P45_002173 [Maudiozyma exigua]|uniref:Association with the SNF1 complex (ASC) domain-containing protein n=1 Tax=Maudiozyma exigua TaxID=34358 RepID=A0A9P6VXD9_MAUEX|nr:hypothetical protein C6P45_002173 [Kazachstania exigua]